MKTPRILAPFSRITSGRALIPEIDGLRFFAIFTVVLYHLNTQFQRVTQRQAPTEGFEYWLYEVMERLGLGVQVFFAISGFILALPFARYHILGAKPVALNSYFWRRLTRLEPPYILSLLLFFAAGVVIGEYTFGEGMPHLLASIGYLHNIIYDAWSTINPVAWSLEVEVQFYVLAPVLAFIFKIKNTAMRRAVIILILLSSILWSFYFQDFIEDIRLRKSLVNNLHFFLTGFLLADFYLVGWEGKKQRRSFVYDFIGLAALPLLCFGTKLHPTSAMLFPLGVVGLFLSAFRGRLVGAFFTNAWIVTIGGMCYTLYLLHYAFLAFVMKVSTKVPITGAYFGDYAIQCLLVLPLLLIVSGIFFALFERPFMRKDWPQQVIAKLKGGGRRE